MEGGYVVKPSNGWYSRVNPATGEVEESKVREKATLEEEFWKPILALPDFKEFLKRKFTIGYSLAADKALAEEDNE